MWSLTLCVVWIFLMAGIVRWTHIKCEDGKHGDVIMKFPYMSSITFYALIVIGGLIPFVASAVDTGNRLSFIDVAFFVGGALLSAVLGAYVIEKIPQPQPQFNKIKCKTYWEEYATARQRLEQKGRYPQEPDMLDGTSQEWEHFTSAVNRLREQGELPPISDLVE
jgi:hypothetical protein